MTILWPLAFDILLNKEKKTTVYRRWWPELAKKPELFQNKANRQKNPPQVLLCISVAYLRLVDFSMTNKQGVIIIHRVKSAAAEKTVVRVGNTADLYLSDSRTVGISPGESCLCTQGSLDKKKKTTITLCLLYL